MKIFIYYKSSKVDDEIDQCILHNERNNEEKWRRRLSVPKNNYVMSKKESYNSLIS